MYIQFVADYLLRQGCEKTLASLRNANKEIWSRDSAVDDNAAAACIPGDDSATMETTMENGGVEHSMSKCNKEKDGNATMMQVEFSNEDWTDRLVADAGRTVEMEEYDSSSCCNDGDEEKKSEEEDKGGMKTTTIPVSSILLNGVSMERFEGNLQVRSAVRQHLLSGDVANAMDLLRWVLLYLFRFSNFHIVFSHCYNIITLLLHLPDLSSLHWNKNHIFGVR